MCRSIGKLMQLVAGVVFVAAFGGWRAAIGSPGQPAEVPKPVAVGKPQANAAAKGHTTQLGPVVRKKKSNYLEKPDPDLAVDAEKKRLKARVEARWAAVLKMDFDTVYTFATPAYRATYEKKHFFNQYGGQIRRTGAEVRRIRFDNPAKTQATVYTAVQFFLPDAFPNYDLRGEDLIRGTWVKEASEWWYVEPR